MSEKWPASFEPPPEVSGSAAWSRLQDELRFYRSKANEHQTRGRRITLLLIVVAASLPFLALLPATRSEPLFAAGAGVLIAVLEGLLLLHRHGEMGPTYRQTADALEREQALFLAAAGAYRDLVFDESLRQLAVRTNVLLGGEERPWVQAQSKSLDHMFSAAPGSSGSSPGRDVTSPFEWADFGRSGEARSAPRDPFLGLGDKGDAAFDGLFGDLLTAPSGAVDERAHRPGGAPSGAGRRSTEAPLRPPPAAPTEPVQFRAYTPKALVPGEPAVIDIWACLPDQAAELTALALGTEQSRLAGLKAGARLARGTEVQVRLESADMVVDPPMQPLVWNGDITNVSFAVVAARDGPTTPVSARATFAVAGMSIGEIRFVLPRALPAAAVGPGRDAWNAVTYRSAFASYSSDDREQVLTTIRGMNKVVPDLDVFVDVIGLRSGDAWRERLRQEIERRERLFLFWSGNARQSKYVDYEWRLALSVHGLKAIDPVPLESPASVKPPDELRSLHFDDAYLAFIDAARRRSAHVPPAAGG